jgi:hypothetical protein
MPLPVIFKFLSDTSGLKFNEVGREIDGLKLSSQKTSYAIRSLVQTLSDSKDPVVALASSVDGLTRAFRLGIGATIAVTAISETIKVFVGNAEKMNRVTEMLTGTIKDFQSSVGLMNFEGATNQVRKLSDALAKARMDMPTSGGGGFIDEILTKTGAGIANIALSKQKAELAVQEAETAKKQAQYAAETALQKENELAALRLINPEQAKQLEITNQYANKIEEMRRGGTLNARTQQLLEQRRDIDIAAALAPAEERKRQERLKSYQSALGGAGGQMQAIPQASQPSIFAGITDEVRVIKSNLIGMYELMERRLGVPILRSAQ